MLKPGSAAPGYGLDVAARAGHVAAARNTLTLLRSHHSSGSVGGLLDKNWI
ncbi:MAG: hypothetical protein ACREMA_06560 [Longimicrobiales bacterium]